MKNSHTILISIAMFGAGVLLGPNLKTLFLGGSTNGSLPDKVKSAISLEAKDSSYATLMAQYGSLNKASALFKRAVIKGQENKIPEYTLAKIVLLIQAKVDERDYDNSEKYYEGLLKVLKDNKSITEERNLKNQELISIAHLLAGKSAAARGKFDLAEVRFAKALEFVNGIDDLNWLKFYIIEQRGRNLMAQKNFKDAIPVFEEVLAYKRSTGIISQRALSSMDLLVNLCYLSSKTGDEKRFHKYTLMGMQALPRDASPNDIYKLYFEMARNNAAYENQDPKAKEYLEQIWRVIMLNSI